MKKVTFEKGLKVLKKAVEEYWKEPSYNKEHHLGAIKFSKKLCDTEKWVIATTDDNEILSMFLMPMAASAVVLRKLYENDMVIEPTDFAEVIEEMKQIHAKKDADYGSSFDRSLDEDGLLVAKIRIGDKVNRLLRLTQPDAVQQVQDESIKDTLIDLANYCVMTVVWVRNKVAEQEEDEE